MIHVYRFEHMTNRGLVQAIQRELVKSPGTQLGAQRGRTWASLKLTAQEWADIYIDGLDQAVRGHLFGKSDDTQPRIEWWMTAHWPGGETDWHDHRDAKWSGVYYPETGAQCRWGGPSGVLEIGGCLITPREGLLVTFDPGTPHRVHPVDEGTGVRYSLAFNVMP